MRRNRSGEISYEIEKSYPDFKTFLILNIGNDTYKVAEDRTMNWHILPDKKQIAGYTTQKSQTEFAGRKWIAWFTTEVPIQDGPYKFSGLPGLIVEVSDETGSHKMELKGLKKIAEKQAEELNTQGKDIPLLRKKPIEVSRTQYVKQLKQHENDPVQGMRVPFKTQLKREN